jgi:8-oxo-dGTP diphosphatase
MKSNSPLVSVTAAILKKNHRIIIAQRKSTDHLAGKWEFPGGKIEEGETPEECLKRELNEEFAVDIIVGEYLGESIYHYEHISIKLMAYRAYWVGGTLKSTDHKDFQWVNIEQLRDYDFAPADIPFVKKLLRGDIELHD